MVTGAQLKRERERERERKKERERERHTHTHTELGLERKPNAQQTTHFIGREKCHHNLFSYVVDRTISTAICTQHQILPPENQTDHLIFNLFE